MSATRNMNTELAAWRAIPEEVREDYLLWLKARHDRLMPGDTQYEASGMDATGAALALLRAAAEPEAKVEPADLTRLHALADAPGDGSYGAAPMPDAATLVHAAANEMAALRGVGESEAKPVACARCNTTITSTNCYAVAGVGALHENCYRLLSRAASESKANAAPCLTEDCGNPRVDGWRWCRRCLDSECSRCHR
jgi:hypothetical protein